MQRSRRDVVLGAHVVGQREQAVELRRHHVRRGHLVLVDQLEHALGCPLVHEHDRVAHVQRVGRPHQHGGVVERRAGDVHVVVERLHAEHALEAGVQLAQDVGVDVDERRASRPWACRWCPTCSASARRRCDRRGWSSAGRRPARSTGGSPSTVADREARCRRATSISVMALVISSAKRSWPTKHLGVAVVDDVGDLGADEVVVDRREVEPDLHGAEVELDHLDAVGQHAGDGVARLEARAPAARG